MAGCSGNNSFSDPTGTCDLLTRSEVGTQVRLASGFQTAIPTIRSCTYWDHKGAAKRLSLVVRTYATNAEALQWLTHDAEKFGVPTEQDATHYRYERNGVSTATAVHGRFAISLDDVGPFTNRDNGALEILAETAARRATAPTTTTSTEGK
ncbi:MAG: hypothetical protein JWL72_2577 [Ilumatobacteraceae bacterium]|nr:hypothetical protein [Ilumatobacteraceae bacterium]MCU1389239.1 hypothetical protein [Ilumatobacteraceae bacterium]